MTFSFYAILLFDSSYTHCHNGSGSIEYSSVHSFTRTYQLSIMSMTYFIVIPILDDFNIY